MKLRQYLKSPANHALSLIVVVSLLSGCTSSTKPTYPKEKLTAAIQDVCKNEYKIDVKATLAGSTLYVYVPLEDLFIKADKPLKYTDKFSIEDNTVSFENNTLQARYFIKTIADQEKTQEVKFNENCIRTINNVWKVLRRVLFSMGCSVKDEPKFLYIIAADIKNGVKSEELTYYLDLKKVSYDFISWGEYQHRSIQNIAVAPEIIEDKEGKNISYKDITAKEFIASQIQQRIKLKFQKPEVEKNADIDKEISKIISTTIKIYDFKDFSQADLYNLVNNARTILNRKAILEDY
jgi:hypothetical protein